MNSLQGHVVLIGVMTKARNFQAMSVSCMHRSALAVQNSMIRSCNNKASIAISRFYLCGSEQMATFFPSQG